MKQIIQHETYGEIIFEESAFSGKKKLTVGGVALEAISKKEFRLPDEGGVAVVNGGFFQGATLVIGGETVRLTPSVKWYEIVLCVLPLILNLIWGNSVTLCSIIPVIGGAIGGALCGVFCVLGLFLMKSVKPIWLKIIIGVANIGITFGICCAIGFAVVAALV